MDIIGPTIPLCKDLSGQPSDRIPFTLKLYLVFSVNYPRNDGVIVKESDLVPLMDVQQRKRIIGALRSSFRKLLLLCLPSLIRLWCSLERKKAS